MFYPWCYNLLIRNSPFNTFRDYQNNCKLYYYWAPIAHEATMNFDKSRVWLDCQSTGFILWIWLILYNLGMQITHPSTPPKYFIVVTTFESISQDSVRCIWYLLLLLNFNWNLNSDLEYKEICGFFLNALFFTFTLLKRRLSNYAETKLHEKLEKKPGKLFFDTKGTEQLNCPR